MERIPHQRQRTGYFFGKPDTSKYLGGSEVGFEVQGLGVFHGPNLTSDKETGLGSWTDAQIIAAMQKGVRPDGRVLAPIMPWRALASLTPEDARAIVAYLRSVPSGEEQGAGSIWLYRKTKQLRHEDRAAGEIRAAD